MSLADQLWIARRTPPNRQSFNQVANDYSFGIKPKGGLWTSTYSPETGSGWVEWCLGEQYNVPAGYRWRAWLFKPPADSLVLHIDTYADLVRVLEGGFGISGPGSSLHAGGMGLDFEKLAQHYDAIHLTDQGQWETRLSHPHSLYGWDCESTIWLHWPWAYGEIIDLGTKTWGKPEAPSTRGRLRRARRDL